MDNGLLQTVLSYWWIIPIILVLVLYKFVMRLFGVIMIPDDSLGIVNKKFVLFGAHKALPDGAIVAMNGEAGIQANTLPPGVHFLYWPWQFEITVQKFITVPVGNVGVVESRDGKPLAQGRVLAANVDCDMFQDATKFLQNGGERGIQINVIPPGTYRINTGLFSVKMHQALQIEDNMVGIVTTKEGKPLPTGEIAGRETQGHNMYQDGQAFVNNGGFKGLQEQVMLQLFQLSPALYITGGEPLLHSQLENVLKMAREIGFYPITVNTNGLRLQNHPNVMALADRIIVSLHSHSVRMNARIFGVMPTRMARAMIFLAHARKLALQHGNKLIINCVLTEENLKDAVKLVRFCLRCHLPLTVVPAITNHRPALQTAGEDVRREYAEFIELLLSLKRKAPWYLACTAGYLRRIKDFGNFKCRPLCILTVNPDGTVQTPCLQKYPEAGATLGSLLTEDANTLVGRSLDLSRAYFQCGYNCCKACYVEPALALEHPFRAIREFRR